MSARQIVSQRLDTLTSIPFSDICAVDFVVVAEIELDAESE